MQIYQLSLCHFYTNMFEANILCRLFKAVLTKLHPIDSLVQIIFY